MILNKLSIKGFGKLKNVNIDLKPGFNIIYGKNESGKSTLLTFIKGIFYGLSSKSKKDEFCEFERYQPWSNEEYSGMLEYSIDGKEYKVGRNFKINKVSICDEFWDDITDKFPRDKKKGSLFAESHLGINEECFLKTIFIRQLESRISEGSKELIDKLINVQQTGNDDISYMEAIELLENISKDKIGSSKTRKKPLNIIEDDINELEKQKNEVILLKNQISDINSKIKEKTEIRTEILDKIERNKDLKASIKKQDLVKIYNKAKEYETSLEDINNQIARLIDYENFPMPLVEQLKEVLLELKSNYNNLEAKTNKLNEINSEAYGVNTKELPSNTAEDIYEGNINLEMLGSETKQKVELENKLSSLIDELSELEIEVKSLKGEDYNTDEQHILIDCKKQSNIIQNKIDKVNQIKKQITKIEDDIKNISVEVEYDGELVRVSMIDIDNVRGEYSNINNYLQLINHTNLQLKEIKDTISELEKLSENTNNIENDSYDTESSMKVNDKTSTFEFLIRLKNNKHTLSIIFFSLTLLLLGYSVLKILFSFNNSVYSSIILSMIFCIFGITNLAKIQRDNLIINEERKYSKPKDLINNQKITKTYNEETHNKLSSLKMELDNKINYLNIITEKYQLSLQKIYKMLDLFSIDYSKEDLSDKHIEYLLKSFEDIRKNNTKNSITNIIDITNEKNALYDQIKEITNMKVIKTADIDVVIINLENEKQKSLYVINDFEHKNKQHSNEESIDKIKKIIGIEENIESKKSQISYIKESIEQINTKIDKLTNKLIATFDKLGMEYEITENYSSEDIDILKNELGKFSNIYNAHITHSVLKDNMNDEVERIKRIISDLEQTKKYIFENAMVTDEQEFFESYNKYIKLNELKEEKRRLISISNEVLNGENSNEILERITSLKDADTNQNIDISIEQLDAQIDEFHYQIKEIDEEILNLKNETSNLLNGRMELNEIVEKIELLKIQKDDLITKKQAVDVAVDIIKEAQCQIQKEFSPKFQKEMSKIISKITDGKYSEIKVNQQLDLNVINPQTGQIVSVKKLSHGTIDQLYLGLRIALSNLINNNTSKLPLIVDEAFVQYDDVRLKNVLEYLIEEANERQILLFTCQKREIDIVKTLGIDNSVNIIELVDNN